jgi:KDO2-lipid IV(A) lauroyltransferase
MGYYFLYKIGQFLALSLPLKGAYWLAEKIGAIWFHLNRKAQAKVLENLKVILGQSEEEKLKPAAREVFVNFAKYLVEFFRLRKLDSRYIKEKIKFKNFKSIEPFRNKGVILLGAHLGNWELAAAVMTKFGFKLNAIALKHKYRKIDLFFKNQRERHGIKIMSPSVSIRSVFEKLKKGEALAVIGDRNFSSHGIEMDFFNRPTLIPKGPAFFSLKTGCPIICLFPIREKDNSFIFFIEDPIYPPVGGFNEENLKKMNKEILKTIEKYIKKYYTQWLMIHRLWGGKGEEREEII